MREWILGCGAVLALAAASPDPQAAAARRAASPCCFVHQQYSGVCTVSSGETCAAILAYLNDPQSQGKTYCRNTSLRGGWKQRECSGPSAKRSGRRVAPAAGP